MEKSNTKRTSIKMGIMRMWRTLELIVVRAFKLVELRNIKTIEVIKRNISS